ncbi:hypothetical protein [Leclercia tamurae]|uniref:Uncharacterized protein n=1 Tax=Leclercia tamurae TaxID=2926467 RepID=A0ABT2R724_9ENTR|nr:hypothetical protein [Leclercia tamurae]MCU6676679.1 hypothetical protein [Leclercia tamurae]
MADHIALLKAIEQDTKEWSEGKRVEAISKKLAWILLVVLAAFFVTTMLNSQMRSYSVFSLPPASILVMFLIHELNMPAGWDEVIERKLRTYKPRDLDAWNTLRSDVLSKGKLECDDVRKWLEYEFKVNADLLSAPGSTHSDQFFRRNVEHSETRGSRK